jgi:glycosyltransferase involved in cell wall biosynthesis
MLSNFDSNQLNFGEIPAVVAPRPGKTVDDVRTLDDISGELEALCQLSQQLLEEEYSIDPLRCEVPTDFKLTVVIPVYNEVATLYNVVGKVCALPVRKEIVLVDDCSTDGTRDLLKEIESYEGIRVIYQQVNQGKGAALRAGFAAASGDVIIVQDADLEYSPADITRVIEPLIQKKADVVYGSRFLGDEPQDKSWVHRLGNGVLTKASNLTTGLNLTDMETCYKAFRREVLAGIEIEQNRFGFEPEITAKLASRHARFAEVPISYQARTYEEGKKIGIKDLFNAFFCIAKYGVRSS